jgi:hypothetical protein
MVGRSAPGAHGTHQGDRLAGGQHDFDEGHKNRIFSEVPQWAMTAGTEPCVQSCGGQTS